MFINADFPFRSKYQDIDGIENPLRGRTRPTSVQTALSS